MSTWARIVRTYLGLLAGLATTALLVAALPGWLPVDGGRGEDRLVEDEVLVYEIEQTGRTHVVEVAGRPAGDEPAAGPAEGRTAEGRVGDFPLRRGEP